MRTRWVTFALFTALGPAFAACDNATSPVEPEPEFTQIDEAADLVIDVAALDRGEGDSSLFDQLAAEIPGFAGFWFDRGCNLNVVLTDLEQSEKAKEVLTPYLRRYVEANPRCPDSASIVIHKGEFSWRQLSHWLGEMRPAAALDGVKRLGISIQKNRIVAAVTDRSTAMKVLEIAQRQGVPTSAIAFVLAQTSDGRGTTTSGRTRTRG